MKYELKELDMNMGRKEYDIYQKRKERQENKKNETYEDKKTNINWYQDICKTSFKAL